MDELKQKIAKLSLSDLNKNSLENLNLTSEFNNLNSEEEKEESLNYLVERLKELLNNIEEEQELNEAKQSVSEFLTTITDFSKVDEINSELSQITIKNNEQDSNNSPEENLISDEEYEEMQKRIQELEENLSEYIDKANDNNLSLTEYLESEINRLKDQKSQEMQEIDNQITTIEKELARRTIFITTEELENQKTKLKEEQKNIFTNNSQFNSSDNLKRYQEINSEISNIDKELNYRTNYANLSNEELQEQQNKLLEEQQELIDRINTNPNEEDIKKYLETNELIEFLKKENIRKQEANKEPNELEKYSNEEIIEEIEKLKEEQKTIWSNPGQEPVKSPVTTYQKTTLKISELEAELERRKNDPLRNIGTISEEQLKKILENLKKKRSKIQSSTDKSITNLKTKLQEAKELEQLKERVKVKQKKIINKENRQDLLYKGLAATAGVAVGLGLSTVPGVGVIRMGIAGAKLATSGINAWTKKYPEGKIANIVNDTKDKFNQKTAKFKETHPNITSKIELAKQKIKELDLSKLNWFINGVAAGYLAGNILGIENLVHNSTTKAVEAGTYQTGAITDSISNASEEIITNTDALVSTATLEPGQVVDISGIEQGLVASDSNNLVDLITSAGKEAVVDKFQTLPNGEVMVHFKQIDGSGYAWFNLTEVQDYLAQTAGTIAKSK